MARVVPNALRERLTFFKVHAPTWVAKAASIGLSPAQAASVQDLTDEANDALAAQVSAMEAAKSATVRYQNAMERLTNAGTAAVATIKAFADSSGEPGPVYVAANIAPPKKPTRHTDLPLSPVSSVKLVLGQGGVRVTWDANMGDGRYFEIYRSLDHGPRTLLTSCHAKTFTDASVPSGTEVVGYDVIAVKGHRRSQLRGSSLQLFGFSAPSAPELHVA